MSINIISDLATDFPASGIRKMFDLSRGMDDIVNLCNGEPNFNTPEYIKDSAISALNNDMTKYDTEAGLTEMRQAVADKYKREFQGDYDINNVMISIGGVEGIFLSLITLLNPGDEVIIPDPTYTCYVGQTLALGGKPVRVPLYEESGFRITPEDLEKAITPKSKVLILSYPSNPLGAVLDKDTGEKLAKIIKKHNLTVISDEVYEKIIFDGRKHFSMSQIESIKDQVIVVNSLSKTYAMTGWRLGYVVCTDKNLMNHMYKMQQVVASCLPTFIMKAGADAINGPQDHVEAMRKEYEKRRNILVEGMNTIKGFKCFRTEGSFCTFINIKELGVTSWDLASELLTEAKVMTVAGSVFGHMGEGYLRVCFANSDEEIVKAIDRIKKHIDGKY